MTQRGIQNSLPLDFQATTPTVYTGGDDQRLVVPVDVPTRGIIVIGGVPYILTNPANAVLTSVTADGTFLRTIDGGTTPIFVKLTATTARIRLATYRMTATGLILAQGLVSVGIRGADLTTTTGPMSITYAKGSGSLAVSDLTTGVGAGCGQFATGTGGDLGLLDATVTFGATTGVKTVTLGFGGDQYVLAVDIT